MSFDENKINRAPDGKFAPKDGSASEAVIGGYGDPTVQKVVGAINPDFDTFNMLEQSWIGPEHAPEMDRFITTGDMSALEDDWVEVHAEHYEKAVEDEFTAACVRAGVDPSSLSAEQRAEIVASVHDTDFVQRDIKQALKNSTARFEVPQQNMKWGAADTPEDNLEALTQAAFYAGVDTSDPRILNTLAVAARRRRDMTDETVSLRWDGNAYDVGSKVGVYDTSDDEIYEQITLPEASLVVGGVEIPVQNVKTCFPPGRVNVHGGVSSWDNPPEAPTKTVTLKDRNGMDIQPGKPSSMVDGSIVMNHFDGSYTIDDSTPTRQWAARKTRETSLVFSTNKDVEGAAIERRLSYTSPHERRVTSEKSGSGKRSVSHRVERRDREGNTTTSSDEYMANKTFVSTRWDKLPEGERNTSVTWTVDGMTSRVTEPGRQVVEHRTPTSYDHEIITADGRAATSITINQDGRLQGVYPGGAALEGSIQPGHRFVGSITRNNGTVEPVDEKIGTFDPLDYARLRLAFPGRAKG